MSELIDNVLEEAPEDNRSKSSAWHARAVQVVRLYQITFNRVPDRAGLDYWTSSLDGRQTLDEVATLFAGNAEFNTLYGARTPHSFYQEFLGNAFGADKTIPPALAWKPELSHLSTGQLLVKLAQTSEISTHLKPHIGIFLDGLHNGTENYIGSLFLRVPPSPTVDETGKDEPAEALPSPAPPVELPAAPSSPPVSTPPADESVSPSAVAGDEPAEPFPSPAPPVELPVAPSNPTVSAPPADESVSPSAVAGDEPAEPFPSPAPPVELPVAPSNPTVSAPPADESVSPSAVAGDEPAEPFPSPAPPVELPVAPSNPTVSAPPSEEIVNPSAVVSDKPVEEGPGNAASADRESIPVPPAPLIQNPNACLAPGDDGAANPPNRTEHVISSSYQPFFGTPYSDFIRASSYVISSNTERPQVNSSVLQRSTVNGCAGYDVLALEMSETVIDSELVNIEELWVRAAQADPRDGLYAEPAKDGAIINGYGFGQLQTLILDSLPFRLKVPNLDSDVSVHIRNAGYSTTLNFGPARSWGSERDVRIAGMASDLHVNGATWLKLTFNGAINGVTSLDAPSLLSLRVIGESDVTLDLSPATVPKLRFVNATELAGRLILHHERGSGGQEISQLRVDGSPAGNDFSWYGLRHIFITTGNGADVIRTDLGNDTIYAGGGRNTIFTGPGYDRIVIENAGQSTLSDDHDNMTVIGDFDAHGRDKIAFSFLKHADFASSALLGDIQNAIDALPPRAHLKDAYFKATEIADGCGWFAFKGNTYIFVDNAEHTLVKIVGLHNPILAERTFSDPWTVIM